MPPKQDFVVLDLGSQVPKGASFVVTRGRARLLSYTEEDLGPREESFTLVESDYTKALVDILDRLTVGSDFTLILSLPLHHLVFLSKEVQYTRQSSFEPVSAQELKNLFFYWQSRFVERIKKEKEGLFFVAGALSTLRLDQKDEILGCKGKNLTFSLIQAFAPRYLINFIRTAFSGIKGDKISFFCFPLGLKGREKKLLVVDSGAAKLGLTEIQGELVRNVTVVPWGGLDITHALLKKGESLPAAEARKKRGEWPQKKLLADLLELVLASLPPSDEATQVLLAGRSWPEPWEAELRQRIAGHLYYERELNQELGLPPELPLSVSSAMRFTLFEQEESPQRLFQRITALSVH